MRAIGWRTTAGAILAVGTITLAVPALAAPPVAPHPRLAKGHVHVNNGVKTNVNHANNANHAAVLSTLHHAHTLLATADHDYDGQRAKAAAEVSHAIHALGGHHHGQHGIHAINAAQKIAVGVGGRNAKPQAQSDAQLKHAGQLIASVQGHVPAGHKANAHLQNAIGHLTVALKIR